MLKLLPERTRGAEIGVWSGDFSKYLLGALNPIQLHLVDPWKFRREQELAGSGYSGLMAKSQDDMDRLYAYVSNRFEGDNRVSIHRADSIEAAKAIPDQSLDWVYIDGDHRYQAVLTDLRTWSQKVVRKGLLTGDDYGVEGWWRGGVTRAVNEFICNGYGTLIFLQGNQYAIRVANDNC